MSVFRKAAAALCAFTLSMSLAFVAGAQEKKSTDHASSPRDLFFVAPQPQPIDGGQMAHRQDVFQVVFNVHDKDTQAQLPDLAALFQCGIKKDGTRDKSRDALQLVDGTGSTKYYALGSVPMVETTRGNPPRMVVLAVPYTAEDQKLIGDQGAFADISATEQETLENNPKITPTETLTQLKITDKFREQALYGAQAACTVCDSVFAQQYVKTLVETTDPAKNEAQAGREFYRRKALLQRLLELKKGSATLAK